MSADMNVWKKLVLDAVDMIADEKEQKKEWIDNMQTTHFTPVEFFCLFFSNAAVDEYVVRKDTGLVQEQLAILTELVKEMHTVADKYPNHYLIDPEVLINDPDLQKCRDSAKQFLATM